MSNTVMVIGNTSLQTVQQPPGAWNGLPADIVNALGTPYQPPHRFT